jgi:hypothetical protein
MFTLAPPPNSDTYLTVRMSLYREGLPQPPYRPDSLHALAGDPVAEAMLRAVVKFLTAPLPALVSSTPRIALASSCMATWEQYSAADTVRLVNPKLLALSTRNC